MKYAIGSLLVIILALFIFNPKQKLPEPSRVTIGPKMTVIAPKAPITFVQDASPADPRKVYPDSIKMGKVTYMIDSQRIAHEVTVRLARPLPPQITIELKHPGEHSKPEGFVTLPISLKDSVKVRKLGLSKILHGAGDSKPKTIASLGYEPPQPIVSLNDTADFPYFLADTPKPQVHYPQIKPHSKHFLNSLRPNFHDYKAHKDSIRKVAISGGAKPDTIFTLTLSVLSHDDSILVAEIPCIPYKDSIRILNHKIDSLETEIALLTIRKAISEPKPSNPLLYDHSIVPDGLSSPLLIKDPNFLQVHPTLRTTSDSSSKSARPTPRYGG